MTTGQTVVLLIEVGVIAFCALVSLLVGYRRVP